MSLQLIEFRQGWYVRFYLGAAMVDEAGPFDEREEAEGVMERARG